VVYDPHEHADELGIRLAYDEALPAGRCGEYRHDESVIVMRPGLSRVRERCVLAHEIAHWENGDVLTGDRRLDAKIERNADLVAGRRLIGSSISLVAAAVPAGSISMLAHELDVTPRILRVYLEAGEHRRMRCGFVA